MITILTLIFFILGLIIGSFLNVVIIRLNTEKSFGGRSACMSCQNQLVWYELVPVFSFLFLRGRCRNCKARISIQYPLVEFATGLIFALLFLKFSVYGGQYIFFTPEFFISYAYYAVMFSLLIVIATYDLKHKIIPDTLAMVLGILAFVGLFFFNPNVSFLPYFHFPSFLDFFSGVLVSAIFALFWLVSKGTWMGLGDAKLSVGLGWLLGFSLMLSGVVIAFWIGAVVGLALVIFSKKHGMKTEIPFAPYLVLGALLAFLFELHLF